MTAPSPKAAINFGVVSGNIPIDCSRGNVFELVMSGNVRLIVTNLYPGEMLSVYVSQDGVGGHSITWGGETIQSSDLASLLANQGANTSTNFYFIGVNFDPAPGEIRLIASTAASGGGVPTTAILPDAAAQNFNPATQGTRTVHNGPLTQNNVVTLTTAGMTAGIPLTMRRSDSTVWRVFYVDGSTGNVVASLDRPGDTQQLYFDGTHYVLSTEWQPDLDITLEQFEPNAGQGDAVVDTRAFKAALACMSSVDASPLGNFQVNLANRRLKLIAPRYLISDYLLFQSPSFYNSMVIEGRLGGTTAASGTVLEWVGGTGFVMTGAPALVFDAAAKTITRVDGGSFITDGLVAGMIFMPHTTTLNNFFFNAVTVTASVITVAATDFMQNEATIAGQEMTDVMYFLRILGGRNTFICNVEFNLKFHVQGAILYYFIPNGPGPISAGNNNQYSYISVYYPRDATNAACIGVGVPPTNNAPSDLAFTRGDHLVCFGDSSNDYKTSTYKAVGWKSYNGNNVKDHVLNDAEISGFKYAIDWSQASGTMSINRIFMDTINTADMIVGNGTMDVTNWATEGSRAMVIMSGTVAQLACRGVQWFGETDETWMIVKGGGQFSMENFVVSNYRCERTVTSVSTVDGTFTYAGNELPTTSDPNGIAVLLRGLALPTGFYLDGPQGPINSPFYYAKTRGGVPGAWTIKLTEGYGGAVVIPTTTGTNVSFESACLIQVGDFYSSVSNVSLRNGQLQTNSPYTPIFFSNGLYYPYPLNQYIPISATYEGLNGYAPSGYGSATAQVRIPDKRGNYIQQITLQPGMNYYPFLTQTPYGGLINTGTTCYVIDFASPGMKNYAGGAITAYVQPQPRCVIKAIRTYVATPFAGPGLVAATFSVSDYNNGAPILQAFLKNVDCKGPYANVADRRKGFVSADYGPNMLDTITVPANAFGAGIPAAPVNLTGGVKALGWAPLYADPNGNISWTGNEITLQMDLALGIAANTLTAGRLEIYIDIERIEEPKNVNGVN